MADLDKFEVIDDGQCFAEVIGGQKTRIAVIRKCDVTAIPKKRDYNSPTTNVNNLCLMEGAFAFREGRAPIIVDCISDSVSLNVESQGNTGSKSFKPSGAFKVRERLDAAYLATVIINAPCYVILETLDGTIEMVGNDSFPAYVTPKYAGGENAAAERGYEFSFEAAGQTRIHQYLNEFSFNPEDYATDEE